MKVTHAQLEEAKQYVNTSIKEVFSSEADWEDLTDEEYVAKAKYDMGKGDFYIGQEE